MKQYLGVTALMVACTVAGTLLLSLLSVTDVAMLYLVTVGVAASWAGRRASVFAAFLSIALFDFFFVPPRFTFAVADLHYVLTFAVMLGCALTISELAQRLRSYGDAARERERRLAGLYAMSHELVPTMELSDLVGVIARHVHEAFAAQVQLLLRDAHGRLGGPVGVTSPFSLDEQEQSVAQWVFDHWQMAGSGTDQFPGARTLFVPLVASTGRFGVLALRPEAPDQFRDSAVRGVVETFAGQAALALERARALLAEQAVEGRT